MYLVDKNDNLLLNISTFHGFVFVGCISQNQFKVGGKCIKIILALKSHIYMYNMRNKLTISSILLSKKRLRIRADRGKFSS